MPSQRKRIGFLPSEEVHDIIEKLCRENKYSQSKVTGILVEEALRYRGVFKNSFSNNININNENRIDTKKQNNSPIINDLSSKYEFPKMNKKNIKEDIKMINEYIEFKLFKKIMNQNNNIFEE